MHRKHPTMYVKHVLSNCHIFYYLYVPCSSPLCREESRGNREKNLLLFNQRERERDSKQKVARSNTATATPKTIFGWLRRRCNPRKGGKGKEEVVIVVGGWVGGKMGVGWAGFGWATEHKFCSKSDRGKRKGKRGGNFGKWGREKESCFLIGREGSCCAY